MESEGGEWNGDVDLGDGKLQAMRKEYDLRITEMVALVVKKKNRKELVNVFLCVLPN